MIRARLAFQVKGEHRYTGIANAFHTIYLKVIYKCKNGTVLNTIVAFD